MAWQALRLRARGCADWDGSLVFPRDDFSERARENTARVRDALRDRYGLDQRATAFFDFFATPVPGFEEAALAVIAAGFAHCDSERQVRRTARLLQSYELDFWLAVGEPTVAGGG